MFIEILLEERPAQKCLSLFTRCPSLQRIHHAAAFVAPQRGAGGGFRGTSPNGKSNASTNWLVFRFVIAPTLALAYNEYQDRAAAGTRMDTETIGSTEKEQEWIRKYRAALDVASRKGSNLKAVRATFGKVAKILILAIRSVLTKRASTPIPAAAQATKMVVPTSTTPDRRLQGRPSPVVKSVAPGNIHLDADVPEKAS